MKQKKQCADHAGENAMDDAKLASALAKGDRNAFDEIYRKYHIPLYQTAYLITGNASDAEDVLQETFVTAYTKIRELRKPEALRSWLFQILSRCALGMIRRRTREVPDEQIEEKWLFVHNHGQTLLEKP